MQFDYYLVPENGPFTDEDLGAWRTVLAELVSHAWDEWTITVFPTSVAREHRLPRLLEAPDEPDWLDGYVRLGGDRIVLGVLQDDDIRRQLYAFARAVVERRPDTRLIYADRQRPLEKLLPPEP